MNISRNMKCIEVCSRIPMNTNLLEKTVPNMCLNEVKVSISDQVDHSSATAPRAAPRTMMMLLFSARVAAPVKTGATGVVIVGEADVDDDMGMIPVAEAMEAGG